MVKISDQDVMGVAELAQVNLTSQEVGQMRGDLESVLGYFDVLSGVDVGDMEEIGHITRMENVLRSDEVSAEGADMREDLLQNIPSRDGDFIQVKNVL